MHKAHALHISLAITCIVRRLKAGTEVPAQNRPLVLFRVKLTLQKSHHQICMVWQLFVTWKVVDVHNQEVSAFTACTESGLADCFVCLSPQHQIWGALCRIRLETSEHTDACKQHVISQHTLSSAQVHHSMCSIQNHALHTKHIQAHSNTCLLCNDPAMNPAPFTNTMHWRQGSGAPTWCPSEDKT